MFRRLLVGAVIVMAIAGAYPAWQADEAVEAAPANVVGPISFGTGVNDQAMVTGERIEFDRDSGTVWASFEFAGLGPGTNLSYILRLGDDDYAWGPISFGSASSGRMAIPLRKPSGGDDLPGGAYKLFIYEGSVEVARGGFGVKGGRGADNGNARSNSNPDDDDDDD